METSSGRDCGGEGAHTFFTTAGSFFGAPLFFAAGLAAALLALVSGASFFLVVLVRLITGAVSTVGRTRGLALPVDERVPSRAILF